PGEEGPDPHVHRRHTDAFYVLEGELELGLGPGAAEIVRATPGTFVAAPPEVVHTFRNASGVEAVFLNFHAPSMGFGDMLRALRAAAGTWFSAPPGTRHGFRNPGPGRARVLNVHAPDGGFTGRVRGG